jgi:hypothetical protein
LGAEGSHVTSRIVMPREKTSEAGDGAGRRVPGVPV